MPIRGRHPRHSNYPDIAVGDIVHVPPSMSSGWFSSKQNVDPGGPMEIMGIGRRYMEGRHIETGEVLPYLPRHASSETLGSGGPTPWKVEKRGR